MSHISLLFFKDVTTSRSTLSRSSSSRGLGRVAQERRAPLAATRQHYKSKTCRNNSLCRVSFPRHVPPGCRVFTKSMVLRTSSMVDVKENSNGVALLEEKVMAALTQLIVSSLLEKEELESKGCMTSC